MMDAVFHSSENLYSHAHLSHEWHDDRGITAAGQCNYRKAFQYNESENHSNEGWKGVWELI